MAASLAAAQGRANASEACYVAGDKRTQGQGRDSSWPPPGCFGPAIARPFVCQRSSGSRARKSKSSAAATKSCCAKRKGLERAFEILANLPHDVRPEGRVDTPPQRRNGL